MARRPAALDALLALALGLEMQVELFFVDAPRADLLIARAALLALAGAIAAGLPVTLEVTGERSALSPGAELAVYRVVQEALTNAMKHAGGATTLVRFAWGEDALEISVADRGDGGPSPQLAGAGHGLMGMRERLRVYGGEVTTGPRPEGGFEVAARLPLERATASVS
jgi:signal transduction histidine kinase